MEFSKLGIRQVQIVATYCVKMNQNFSVLYCKDDILYLSHIIEIVLALSSLCFLIPTLKCEMFLKVTSFK